MNRTLTVFLRDTITVCAAGFMLAGCGESRPLTPPLGTRAAEVSPMGEDAASWRNLYVVNGAGGPSYFGTVTVYKPGKKMPMRTISKGLSGPFALAFDASGNLYVGNAGKITVYRRGTRSLIRTINLGQPSTRRNVWRLAFDNAGYLYVDVFADPQGSRYHGFVAIYPPGSSRRFATIRKGINTPVDLAIDRAGYVFVANAYNLGDHHNGWISVYPSRSTHLLRTIAYGIPYGEFPDRLAFDGSGNLYSGNLSDITVYAPGSRKVLRIIRHGVNFPLGLRFDSSGNLYVANCTNACSTGYGSVTVFAPGASRPMQIITHGIYNPKDLVFDNAGRLYVANQTNYSVSVYKPGHDYPMEVITRGISDPIAVGIGP
jgi:sugar lactone lactonase YvrE